MKRTKLWKSLGTVVALAAPMTPMLTSLTSCNKINYFQIAKKFKTTALEEFINLSKCRRQTWQEKEAYDYIIERMAKFGYTPKGYDDFGYRDETIIAAKKDLPAGTYDESLNKYGNVWFDVPANPNTGEYQRMPKVIVHAHMDTQMVFKDKTSYEEWRDGKGVDVYYDQDQQIMYSKDYKTSLGADDGVGCAELLSIAKHAQDEDFIHGPIRLLFTCDESGAVNEGDDKEWQSGAGLLALDQKKTETKDYKKPFDTEYVINLDGYDQHDVVRSCAGIHECIYDNMELLSTGEKPIIVPITWADVDEKRHEYELTVNITRPEGANSGADANKGYANALKILSQVIVEWNEKEVSEKQVFRLINATSEGSAYTICPKAQARFVSYLEIEQLRNKCAEFTEMFEGLFPNELGRIKITCKEIKKLDTGEDPRDKYCFDAEYSKNIFYLINVLQFGPVTWLDQAKTKVKTSYNVGPLTATIDTTTKPEEPKGAVNFHTVSRSSDKLQQEIFTKRIHAYFSYFFDLEDPTKDLNDIENEVWEIEENNKMANFIYDIEKSFKYNPVYTDIHSWAEISQFPKIIADAGLPKAQMASFGPTVTGTHSRQETFYVNSIDSVLKTLVYALMNINKIPM